MPASRWRRAWCRRCRACGTAGRRARRGLGEAGLHEGRRGRGRDQHAVGRAAGELQHVGRATRRARSACCAPPLASRRPGDAEDLALEIGHLAGQQRAADRDRFGERPERPRRLDAGGLEIGRRADAEAEDDAAGIHLLEARRRHGDEHRMDRVGTHRHQRDLDALGGAQRQRRHGDGIAQDRDGRRSTASTRRPPPPRAPGPGCRRSARGRPSRCRTQPWAKP